MIDHLFIGIRTLIDEHASFGPYEHEHTLPLYITGSYRFYQAEIAGSACLIVWSQTRPVISQVKKHFELLQDMISIPLVLSTPRLSRDKIRRCISQRIPYITDDMQVYLPFICLLLNEKKISDHTSHERTITSFTPMDQAVFLLFLYHRYLKISPTMLSERFDCSVMSASRALQDLYALGLLLFEVGGRRKRTKMYRRIDNPGYYDQARDFLIDPVFRRFYTQDTMQDACMGGLEALSILSMINPGNTPVRVIGKKEWKESNLKEIPLEIVEETVRSDPKLIEVEVWKYDPKLLSDGKIVDTVSLDTSLRRLDDERINIEIETIIKESSWLKE